MLTSSSLALVPPRQKVLKQVTQELQCDVLEGKSRAVEELEQVQVVLQVAQGGDILVTESRITLVDNVLEVLRGYLGGRDVQGEDVEGELGKGQVLPALPIGGGGDLLGDVEAAVGGEALEHDLLEGQLLQGGNKGYD